MRTMQPRRMYHVRRHRRQKNDGRTPAGAACIDGIRSQGCGSGRCTNITAPQTCPLYASTFDCTCDGAVHVDCI